MAVIRYFFDMGSGLGLIPKAVDVFLQLLLSHTTDNQEFTAGSAEFGNIFGEQRLDKNLQNVGVILLFKEESDCAIFHDFTDFLRVRPIF